MPTINNLNMLYVRDGSGKFVPVPALIGPKGEDGKSPKIRVYNATITLGGGYIIEVEDVDGNVSRVQVHDGKDGAPVYVAKVDESDEDGVDNIVTFSDGTELRVKNGSKGSPGKGITVSDVKEVEGEDGVRVTVVTFSDNTTFEVRHGSNGLPGDSPVKGVDYWTEADRTEIVNELCNTLKPDDIGAAAADDVAELVAKTGCKWKGKVINFLGDSITYGTGTTVRFSDIIAEKIGATCNNYGISGSTVAKGSNPMYDRVTGMDKNADLCIVFGGTNDFTLANKNYTLGEQFTEATKTVNDEVITYRTLNMGAYTFYGGLNNLCRNLYANFPESTLVLCTPINRGGFGSQPDGATQNNNGNYLDDYVKAIKNVASWFGIPCLDLYSVANIHPAIKEQKSLYYTDPDFLHPNTEGHKHLANVILSFIETLPDKKNRIVAEMVSITATYTGGEVVEGTSLETLSDVVVNAHYSDGSTAPVTGYTLSGTISVGTNSITVTYGDFSTSFEVIGVEDNVKEYTPANMEGVVDTVDAYHMTNNGYLVKDEYYKNLFESWKIPCKAGDQFVQYSNSGSNTYKTYWDANDKFIEGYIPEKGTTISFTVPDNPNIAYVWTAIDKKDIADGSFRLVHVIE